MKTVQKIILIFEIIGVILCIILCTVKITESYILKHLEIDYTSNNDIAVTYNGNTEIYKTPVIY
mgnify:FL=1|nr:MAG TPA: hypothetical protein [Caudoviricetes sp.]